MNILQEGLGALGDLRERTRRWLGILSVKGLSVVADNEAQTPAKQGSYRDVTSADRAVRLHNGQIVWLRADAPREDMDQEYRGIDVFEETPEIDKAIIAAVTALETGHVEEDEGLEKAALIYKGETPQSEPLLQNATARDGLNAARYTLTFGYAEELLRHFRPDYDELSRREQAALIQGACKRIKTFNQALEELVAFAEYAVYDAKDGRVRKLKSAAENMQRDVKAALYKHVEDLSNGEIGARLRTTTPRSDRQKIKHDDSTGRRSIARGTTVLRQGWGEEGLKALIASMRSQRDRWRSLPEEDRELEAGAEQIAAFAGIPVKETLRIIKLGEPDESRDGAFYIYKAFHRGSEKLPDQSHP